MLAVGMLKSPRRRVIFRGPRRHRPASRRPRPRKSRDLASCACGM